MCNAKWVLSLVVVLTLAGSAFGATIYVNGAAAGTNNGTSWANAYTNLQTALTGNTGATILVAQGTYKPATNALSFVPENGEKIYGGYNAATGARDTVAFKTILSGDINGDDSYYTLSADPWPTHKYDLHNAGATKADNCGVVVNCDNISVTAVTLDGLSVMYAWGTAALTHTNGKVAINNCIFDNNKGSNAGSILAQTSSGKALLITNSVIQNSEANGGAGNGGGIEERSGGAVTIVNCQIKGCLNWDDHGGGVGIRACATMIVDSLFYRCWGWDCAALDIRTFTDGDGVLSGGNFNAKVIGCVFDDSWAHWTGIVHAELDCNNGAAAAGTQRGYAEFKNCLLKNNYCGHNGGTLSILATNANKSIEAMIGVVDNCTLVDNDCAFSDKTVKYLGITNGCFFRNYENAGGCTIKVSNSILWNPGSNVIEMGPNFASPGIPASWQGCWYGTNSTFRYNDYRRDPVSDPNTYLADNVGNITTDPLFVVSDADYNVQTTSPTIDTGDPASTVDYEAKCNGGRINMGWTGGSQKATSLFESADFNCDGAVNMVDFSTLASQWL